MGICDDCIHENCATRGMRSIDERGECEDKRISGQTGMDYLVQRCVKLETERDIARAAVQRESELSRQLAKECTRLRAQVSDQENKIGGLEHFIELQRKRLRDLEEVM